MLRLTFATGKDLISMSIGPEGAVLGEGRDHPCADLFSHPEQLRFSKMTRDRWEVVTKGDVSQGQSTYMDDARFELAAGMTYTFHIRTGFFVQIRVDYDLEPATTEVFELPSGREVTGNAEKALEAWAAEAWRLRDLLSKNGIAWKKDE